ncbi:MAG: CRISPR-associated helicase Cas3' [Rhodobacteraceae bacterium]|nr:CRISPR-associated helicase Cas3' [Paracoccaceae bacterium]
MQDGNLKHTILYAHSNESGDVSSWEPLHEHLIRVADAASIRGAAFGAEQLAEITGLLHDLGKAKPEFQQKLRGKKSHVSHSGEGARYAVNPDHGLRGLGKLIAYCIAGHHAGLANGKGYSSNAQPTTPLDERLLRSEVVPLPDGLTVPKLTEDIPPALSGPASGNGDLHFRMQFFVRMLFSALVDADFVETEAYYDRIENRKAQRGWNGTLQELQTKLNVYLTGFGNPSGEINRTRARILSHVRAGASQFPGLFSLTVPTGGGKTLASLAFALDHALCHDLRRVIYVVPYTSIVEQTADVFRVALNDDDAVLEHHSSFDYDKIQDPGENEKIRLAAQNWDRPVVVTTAVQFFESLFANRPSKCRKLHNLAKSVIILDDAQALPLHLLRPSLAAIRELARGYGSSLVLCTATQPALRREDGFTADEALEDVRELAPDPTRLYETMRRVQVRDAGDVDDSELAEKIGNQEQALVIVNSRAHARSLFDLILEQPGATHLTTNMTPAHRRHTLADVRRRLNRMKPVRLIATSLIEAGVDVDFPVVWRCLAGIESVAQAAGRCNREGRLDAPGEVIVFRPEARNKPPKELEKHIEIASNLMAKSEDPLSLESVRDYFRQLYWDLDHGLDTARVGDIRGIMKAVGRGGSRLDYPFADIAHGYCMILDRGRPLIIRGGPFGVPYSLLEELRFNPHPGTVARRLQQWHVQVPFWVYDKMYNEGAVETWREEDFGEQFVVLANPDIYDERAGLRWDGFSDIGYQEY